MKNQLFLKDNVIDVKLNYSSDFCHNLFVLFTINISKMGERYVNNM